MTATHEEDNRRWIRMSRYPFVDSLRHVASAFLFLWIIVTLLNGCDASYEMQGPSFVTEPPSRVEFTNVNGGRVDCIVRGNPAPTVDWLAADGGSITSIPGIRHVLGNGTIHFPGFEAEVFRQDVHWAIYKCFAVNSVGAIVSRDVTVRAGTRNFFLVICIMLSACFASSSIFLPLLVVCSRERAITVPCLTMLSFNSHAKAGGERSR
ncbi:Down syndrome cell adhesion molecule-like protein Dscam2 [Frieseomelitta varia]|uniref:Down syndrome cell adhesion molecule-like protein Dscam2 n=1 Tax=Frieseomelitta varia TaxID=561572 RepID=UPI001CB69288|nr:Down syndrome cell adhesion molecule-like protein Dscam2 [Frieseomelitta varia]